MAPLPSRNQQCPCGSGKKYKRCCLEKDEAARSRALASKPAIPLASKPAIPPFYVDFEDDDDLDDLSNGVLDLIEGGRLDAAEENCRLLRERYPEAVDHLERLGAVREAQGRFGEAADLYRQAAEFARSHDGFDPEMTDYYEDRARKVSSRA
jgi:tetratricopeptide (TPR) repeat protein